MDPDNRLVASELEQRWNERLLAVHALEAELAAMVAETTTPVTPTERAQLMQLGADLDRAWHHPAATAVTRKRIVRTVLNEIVVRIEDQSIELVLHWQGGDHTALSVRKNKTGQHRWGIDGETGDLVRGLARLLPDKDIASLLNRAGKRTGRGNGWTKSRVCTFRNDHGIAVYRNGERSERGELTLNEAATMLGVSAMTVLRLIRDDVLAAEQICRGAPWVIKADAIHSLQRNPAVFGRRQRPLTADQNQESLIF